MIKTSFRKAKRQMEYIDLGIRNWVESTYGVAKRKFGLDLIKAKRKTTPESCVVLQFLGMNLERRLRALLHQIITSPLNAMCKIHILGMLTV